MSGLILAQNFWPCHWYQIILRGSFESIWRIDCPSVDVPFAISNRIGVDSEFLKRKSSDYFTKTIVSFPNLYINVTRMHFQYCLEIQEQTCFAALNWYLSKLQDIVQQPLYQIVLIPWLPNDQCYQQHHMLTRWVPCTVQWSLVHQNDRIPGILKAYHEAYNPHNHQGHLH